MSTASDLITESLRNGIDQFGSECSKIMSDTLNQKFTQMRDEIYQNIESKVKNNIAKILNPKEMYDYSNENIVSNEELVKYIRSYKLVNIHDIEKLSSLLSSGEFVVIAICKDYNHRIKSDYVPRYYSEYYYNTHENTDDCFIMTNKGTIFTYYNKHNITFLDFTITKDYLYILKCVTQPGHLIYFDELVNILKYMKDTLYDRKFIPLYAKDIVKENDNLKEQYDKFKSDKDQFEKEKAEFSEMKRIFETESKPYIDLEKDRLELSIHRENLKLAVEKLELEKKKLEKKKEKLESVEFSELLKS